jgi:hypothetical protein
MNGRVRNSPIPTPTAISPNARSGSANCAHCHREGAGGAVVSHFDYDTKPAEKKAIGRLPSQGALGLIARTLSLRGSLQFHALPDHDHRPGRMPHTALGSWIWREPA